MVEHHSTEKTYYVDINEESYTVIITEQHWNGYTETTILNEEGGYVEDEKLVEQILSQVEEYRKEQ